MHIARELSRSRSQMFLYGLFHEPQLVGHLLLRQFLHAPEPYHFATLRRETTQGPCQPGKILMRTGALLRRNLVHQQAQVIILNDGSNRNDALAPPCAIERPLPPLA